MYKHDVLCCAFEHWSLFCRPFTTPSHQTLVLSYTNHALDQFVEEIVHAGFTNIVRVGGRSKSEAMKEYNLSEWRYKRSSQYGHLRGDIKGNRNVVFSVFFGIIFLAVHLLFS